MAKPKTFRPGRFLIMLGDGATPEQFRAPCGFSSKSFTWNRGLSEVNIPDCVDPDQPDWTGRDVQSMSCSLSGEGLLTVEALPTWLGVLNSIESVNVQVELTYPDVGVLLMSGAMQLESFEIGAQQGQRVSANVSMQSDGEMTSSWTPDT